MIAAPVHGFFLKTIHFMLPGSESFQKILFGQDILYGKINRQQVN